MLAVFSILTAGTCGAMPLPEDVARHFPDLRLAGEGRLRWLGLHIYDASLWIEGQRWSADREFVLDIRYARDIKARRLVQTSLDEMRRLEFGDERRLNRWIEALTSVMPDVKKGEHLTGVNRPGQGAEFYYQGKLLGVIADPEFARAFFAIWLDARTREPDLRKSLIGRE
jgi:hypothetical protein